MQVRSVAAIPLSHPLEEGRSFGHARNLLREELMEGPFDPTGGSLRVPTDPGLGVTVERYGVDR